MSELIPVIEKAPKPRGKRLMLRLGCIAAAAGVSVLGVAAVAANKPVDKQVIINAGWHADVKQAANCDGTAKLSVISPLAEWNDRAAKLSIGAESEMHNPGEAMYRQVAAGITYHVEAIWDTNGDTKYTAGVDESWSDDVYIAPAEGCSEPTEPTEPSTTEAPTTIPQSSSTTSTIPVTATTEVVITIPETTYPPVHVTTSTLGIPAAA